MVGAAGLEPAISHVTGKMGQSLNACSGVAYAAKNDL